MKHLKIHKFPFKNVIVLAIECKMYLKIQQKLRWLGCISKQTMGSAVKKTRLNSSKDDFLMKSFPSPQKESRAFFWTFSFHFLSSNGLFLTLKCITLVSAYTYKGLTYTYIRGLTYTYLGLTYNYMRGLTYTYLGWTYTYRNLTYTYRALTYTYRDLTYTYRGLTYTYGDLTYIYMRGLTYTYRDLTYTYMRGLTYTYLGLTYTYRDLTYTYRAFTYTYRGLTYTYLGLTCTYLGLTCTYLGLNCTYGALTYTYRGLTYTYTGLAYTYRDFLYRDSTVMYFCGAFWWVRSQNVWAKQTVMLSFHFFLVRKKRIQIRGAKICSRQGAWSQVTLKVHFRTLVSFSPPPCGCSECIYIFRPRGF